MQNRFPLDPVFVNAPIGVAIMDYDGRYLATNPAYSAIYGYADGEMLGLCLTVVFPKAMHERVIGLHHKFLDEGGEFSGEWEVLRRDGQQLHVISHSVRIEQPDGEKHRFVYVTDITERRQLEIELRRNEERMALVMRGTDDAYFDADLVSGKRNYARRWWEMLGYEVDAWPLDGSHWQRLTHPDDLEKVNATLEEIRGTDANRFEATLRMRHADGSYRTILTRAYVTRDESGKITRLTGANTDMTDRIRIEMEARRYQSIVESSDDAIVSKSLDGIVLSWNAGATRMFGYTAKEMIGRPITVLMPSDRIDEEDLILRRIKVGETVEHFETLRVSKDGRAIDISATISPVRDAQGHIVGASKIARDISFKKVMESRLVLTSAVFANTSEGVAIFDPKGIVVEVNSAFETITGYRRGEVIGNTAKRLFSEEIAYIQASMRRSLEESGHYQGEHWAKRKDGQKFAVLLKISKVPAIRGDAYQYVAMFADITTLLRRQEKLEYLAQHDALTDLPNRSLFADRLQQALNLSKRQSTGVAVVFIDLDGFKSVNDRFGHAAGDTLLQTISGRLKECIRDSDTLARLGGDEFALLMINISFRDECLPLLQRLLAACAKPIVIGSDVCVVSASIGVAIKDEQELTSDALLMRADQAMYIAKETGKNRFHFHSV